MLMKNFLLFFNRKKYSATVSIHVYRCTVSVAKSGAVVMFLLANVQHLLLC